MVETGKTVRALRTEKGLSIANLAEMTGLSTGMISQIERGKVSPTINAMLKIANALDVTMGYFFDRKNTTTVLHKNQRINIATDDDARIYELLAPTQNRKIEFLLVTLDGCTNRLDFAVSHEGEECGYVIEGSMKVIIEGEEYLLHAGDSIYFDSTKKHVYENCNDKPCVSIWAMTPPSW